MRAPSSVSATLRSAARLAATPAPASRTLATSASPSPAAAFKKQQQLLPQWAAAARLHQNHHRQSAAHHHDDHHHDDHHHAPEPAYHPPTGWLWGVRPGEKPETEGWEVPMAFAVASCAVFAIALAFKPNERLDTWALEEARRRLEKEGILEDPKQA
jgi:hypothetical protein